MVSKTRQSLAQPDLQFGGEQLPASVREKLNRLTQTVRALTTELQKLQQAMAGGSTGQVLAKTGSGDYQASWGSAPGGTVSGAKNLGGGAGLFVSLAAGVLQFKSLIEGTNVKLAQSAEGITVAVASGGDTGVGTVTSVGINSADLDIEGTPITSKGSIKLTIKAGAVTYAKMQATSADTVLLGRRLGEGPGTIEELSLTDVTAMGIGGDAYPPVLGYAGI